MASGADMYAFIDVETPNRHNDRVCSIGMIFSDTSGMIVDEFYSLVDPESEFDAINVGIHGINEFSVHGFPTFPRVWERVLPMIRRSRVIAHNAQFDLTVIDKTIDAYGMQHSAMEYADTMRMAKRQLCSLGRYGLADVCRACNVDIADHHNAIADARACMSVFFSLEPPSASDWFRYTPISQRVYSRPTFNVRKSECTKAHNEMLINIMDVLADRRVSLEEAIGLKWWIEKNSHLAESSTVDTLLALLSSVLKDGSISPEEEAKLLESLETFISPAVDSADSDISGKKFCLTGDFDYGSRDDVTLRLKTLGGIPSKTVSKSCDYVIVGSNGSAAYAHGNYGSKIKKAMEWKARGIPMKIITEEECPWL